MASTIQVRVEDDLKTKADALFRDLGTDTTSAIRMFLTQAVMRNGIPFEIRRMEVPYQPLSENEFICMLDSAKSHADQGVYKMADEMIADLRKKYEL